MKTNFEIIHLMISSYPEDTDDELLEDMINKFQKQALKEIYIGYPFQFEAVPLVIETPDYVYNFFEDKNHPNSIHIKKEPQRHEKEFLESVRKDTIKFKNQGFVFDSSFAWVNIA